jgi:iron complex outermembrane receptor protein
MIRLPVRTSAIARLLAASAPLLVFAAPAAAQDQVAAGQAVADPAADQGVGEIVVTATRRQESSKDVPLAVTAISGEKLDVLNSSGLDIRFLAGRTPSLQVES